MAAAAVRTVRTSTAIHTYTVPYLRRTTAHICSGFSSHTTAHICRVFGTLSPGICCLLLSLHLPALHVPLALQHVSAVHAMYICRSLILNTSGRICNTLEEFSTVRAPQHTAAVYSAHSVLVLKHMCCAGDTYPLPRSTHLRVVGMPSTSICRFFAHVLSENWGAQYTAAGM